MDRQTLANDNSTTSPVPAITWTANQVAEALGISRATFDRKRTQFYDQGFPLPVPGLCGRWSIVAVKAWVDGTIETPVDTLGNDIDRLRQQIEDELA